MNNQEIPTPQLRDHAIELIVCTLIMADVILPEETYHYMRTLTGYNDAELEKQLIASQVLLDAYYQWVVNQRRN